MDSSVLRMVDFSQPLRWSAVFQSLSPEPSVPEPPPWPMRSGPDGSVGPSADQRFVEGARPTGQRGLEATFVEAPADS